MLAVVQPSTDERLLNNPGVSIHQWAGQKLFDFCWHDWQWRSSYPEWKASWRRCWNLFDQRDSMVENRHRRHHSIWTPLQISTVPHVGWMKTDGRYYRNETTSRYLFYFHGDGHCWWWKEWPTTGNSPLLSRNSESTFHFDCPLLLTLLLVHVSASVATTTTTFLRQTKSAWNPQIRQSTLNEHQKGKSIGELPNLLYFYLSLLHFTSNLLYFTTILQYFYFPLKYYLTLLTNVK